jgi:hypothetical protein
MMAAVVQDLRDSGCVSKTIRWGVELVANVSGRLRCSTGWHILSTVNRMSSGSWFVAAELLLLSSSVLVSTRAVALAKTCTCPAVKLW